MQNKKTKQNKWKETIGYKHQKYYEKNQNKTEKLRNERKNRENIVKG